VFQILNKALANTILTIILTLAISLQVAGLAKANPVPWLSTPNQDKPTLTVESPQNNTEYDESDVYLNYTITKPDSWNTPFVPFIGQIVSALVFLDGNVIYGIAMSGSYSVKLNQTSPGLHMLNVTVLSYAYYNGPPYNGSHIFYIQSSSSPVYKYPTVLSDIVYFTVAEEPSPSTSALPLETESFSTAAVAAVPVTAVLVIAGLLVYYKKLKREKYA
jgi:hypothetical protein